MKKAVIYDTTLRDGKQAEGVHFSIGDMVAVARLLDNFGMDYIECGWPAANPKDKEFFREIKKYELKNSIVTAFGSTRHVKNSPSKDVNLNELIAADTQAITIFGKSWDLHVTEVFRISLEANLEMIRDSVAYLKDHNREVFFDAEHFFNGFLENPDYAMQALKAAEEGGADTIVLADTNGGMLSHQVAEIVKKVREEIKVPIGIHTHNDSENAVANSLEAFRYGAVQVQGTVNGIGERCGNANLCSIIPNLKLKMNYEFEHIKDLGKLVDLSHTVSELANLIPNPRLPYVGKSAFTHKAGVHVNAVSKNTRTYEHIDPLVVGNERRILISEQAGKSSIVKKASEMGIRINKDQMIDVLDQIKLKENNGYEFEGADASFEILVRKLTDDFEPRFKVMSFKTLSYVPDKGDAVIEATVKVLVGELMELTVAEGDGPVNALDSALKKALAVFYSVVKNVQLTDYKVRITNPKAGTAAMTRVLIGFKYNGYEWGTVGVSENIIEASWEALVDSMSYILMKLEKEGN